MQKAILQLAVVCLLGALSSLVWAQGPVVGPGATVPGLSGPAVPLIAPTSGLPGTPGASGLPGTAAVNPADLVVRVIELKYMNPALAAILFGGVVVYDLSSAAGGFGTPGYGTSGYGSAGYGGGGYEPANTAYRAGRAVPGRAPGGRSAY